MTSEAYDITGFMASAACGTAVNVGGPVYNKRIAMFQSFGEQIEIFIWQTNEIILANGNWIACMANLAI